MEKRKVIIITDGDDVAKEVIERVANEIGGRTISSSAGNPTPISGGEIVKMISETPYDPVLVMFDDNGRMTKGDGERAIEYITNHPDIEVIGAIAVASNTKSVEGINIDYSIDQTGALIKVGVDKEGKRIARRKIYGDTVDVLNKLDIPIIIGIGDIGKMKGHDHIKHGAPITLKAIRTILEWGDKKNEEEYEDKEQKK